MRDFNNKKVYRKYYEGPYKGSYRPKCKRGMNNSEFKILWTLIWLVFIAGLCMLFNSAMPIWMLFIWFFGIL